MVRTRDTCILVDIGGEDKIAHISKVLKNDSNELVQALKDPDKPVRESAAVALSNLQFVQKLSKNEKFAKLSRG